jgi:hypothetical protein
MAIIGLTRLGGLVRLKKRAARRNVRRAASF